MTPSLDDDRNIEKTLLRMQVIVTKIFNYIADLLDKTHVYTGRKRRKPFIVTEMESCRYNADDFRGGVNSFIYDGPLFIHVNGVCKAQCGFHDDVHNDHRENVGCNVNICCNRLVEMRWSVLCDQR